MASRKLLIVDCDCGVDDALALLLALAHKDTWKLLAVTCCYGNTTVDNVCNNVRKVLQLCNETEIPVYRGCERPIVKDYDLKTSHGGDGFGNVGHEYPHDRIKLADGHAVNALINLAKTHRQEGVHLVILGPMTNVALAHRLDSEFTANLKSISFMGGNIYGIGNTTSAAEFNLGCDPEAANIIVRESKCFVTMTPWETTAKHGMPWDFYHELLSGRTSRCSFLRRITQVRLELCKKRGNEGFLDCDFLPMAALLRPEVVQEILSCTLTLGIDGKFSAKPITSEMSANAQQKTIINVIMKFDDVLLKELRKSIVQDRNL